jgi:hypothetical protein
MASLHADVVSPGERAEALVCEGYKASRTCRREERVRQGVVMYCTIANKISFAIYWLACLTLDWGLGKRANLARGEVCVRDGVSLR